MAIGKIVFEAAVVVPLGEMLSVDWILPIFGLPHDSTQPVSLLAYCTPKPMLHASDLSLISSLRPFWQLSPPLLQQFLCRPARLCLVRCHGVLPGRELALAASFLEV
jgi:hypothetical protein